MPSSAGPAPTCLYTLSLHDALPISCSAFNGHQSLLRICPLRVTTSARPPIAAASTTRACARATGFPFGVPRSRLTTSVCRARDGDRDRKSTRLNSSHANSSYAVFCWSRPHLSLHSFPTRRSSDLLQRVQRASVAPSNLPFAGHYFSTAADRRRVNDASLRSSNRISFRSASFSADNVCLPGERW